MLKTILLFCSLGIFSLYFAQRGKDNSYTVSALNTQLNAYSQVTVNAAANATSITVASNTLTNSFFTGALAAGDLIMIIQMQGAAIDVDVTPTASWGGHYTVPNGHQADWGTTPDLWGNVTAYNNTGKYELVEVRSVGGTATINLMCGLKNSYTAAGHVQVVRVPRLVDLTLNASTSIVPALWDGTIGGVVALEVQGNIVFNTGSKISSSGYGFRGGVCDLATNGATAPASIGNTDYSASDDSKEGAEKGEGISGFYTEYDALYSRYSKSAPANGGGGGGNHNCGGGGGSNIGTGTYTGKGIPVTGYTASWNLESAGFATSASSGGGRGGYSYSTSNQDETTIGPINTAWSGDGRRNEGGLGGHPLAYDVTRLFMGGGGGAGDANSNPTQGGAGGRGGGITFLTVYGTVSGTGTVESNGANGQNANPLGQTASAFSATRYGNDAAGGAGGGGVVAIANGTALPASITLSATGGTGGNQVISFGGFVSAPTMEADGPGGGGTGGMIAFTSGTPTQTVAGGGNGVTNSSHLTAFPPNGATMGASGVASLPQAYFDITSPNVTICPNTSTTLTATVAGTLPSGATLTWYSTQFGSVSVGTGTTYTTPSLSSTTTYYVGTCPGTFRVPVVVTVGAGASITGTLTVPVGSTTQLTGSGTPNATTPWASANPAIGSVTSSGLVTGVSVGTVTMTYMNSSGCTVTAIVNVIAPLPVELLYFAATLNERETVDLNWATETELNNDYFTVEKSTDLENWVTICTVDGAGTSKAVISYHQEDSNPFYGMNYYQLKQVDFDGKAIASPIETVYLSDVGRVIVYPNPASDVLHVVGNRLQDQQIMICNSLGQVVRVAQTVVSDDHITLDTQQLEDGVYYIRIVNDLQTELQKINVLHR